MESKDELKKIDIENRYCYYFDDIMRVINVDLDNSLLDKKSYENISLDKKLDENTLIYDSSYNTFMGWV